MKESYKCKILSEKTGTSNWIILYHCHNVGRKHYHCFSCLLTFVVPFKNRMCQKTGSSTRRVLQTRFTINFVILYSVDARYKQEL